MSHANPHEDSMADWHFSSALSNERREALVRAPALADILRLVASQMEVLCCHRAACDGMAGFSRVVFNVAVPQSAFDLFFNSEHGYRGAYFQSPHSGLAANETCVRHLTPALLAWARAHEPSLDLVFVEESLHSPTAKIWLTEFESHLCAKCAGEWGNPVDDQPEIINGRWERANSPAGKRGRKAPYLTKLRVFGAFLNERHDEFTPSRKRDRARELYDNGWS
jgi:hypothetical protein